jgi:N-acetylneuraminic acid mutarotase
LQASTFAGIGFVVPRDEATTVVIGNYLYVVGGASTSSNTVERAAIQADGSLRPFATVPDVALVTPRRRHTAAVIGRYLYIVGGAGAAGTLNTVERAEITANGSLGPFAGVYALSGVRETHSSAVIGNYLYLLGGADSNGPLRSVERVEINADGSLGPSVTFGNALPVPHGGRQNVVVRSSLYVLGGDETTVERANINVDGTLGTFATVPNISFQRPEHFESTATVVGNLLYVLGGEREPGQGDEVSGISPTGSLTGFGLRGGPIQRSGHSTVILGNQLYVIGGKSASSEYLGIDSLELQ